ncbi:glycosyltransferase [Vibrio satsumensis]|uniref:glycosyltransferase n=1 Tax=Vibrio satsumensis TaxID=2910245 RepID=UPI003D0AD5AD
MYKTIYCMVDDDKTQYLKRYGELVGLNIIPNPVKGVLFPFYLMYLIFSNNKPDAVIVRYMNDNRNILLSLALFLSRYLTFIILSFFSVKIVWFCHNIDKETKEFYPFLTKIKRNYLLKKSEKIYVMDELLVPVAVKQFPQYANKIDYICFGVRQSNYRRNKKSNNGKLISVFEGLRDKGEVYIGFCPTNSGNKYLHIDYAPDLVNKAKEAGIELYLVMVGDLKTHINTNIDLATKISKNKNIILIDEFVDYNADEIGKYIDFYWRGLDDQSISYSLYEAATQRVPILAIDVGFVGEAVAHYNLGEVVDIDMADLRSKLLLLESWNSAYADEFLEKHSWTKAVDKLKGIF